MSDRLFKKAFLSKKSFFLFGPRGCGKTTLLKTTLPHCLYIDLLDPEFFLPLMAQPGKLKTLIPPNYSDWIVIDEIQKIPALLNEVHRLIEAEKHRFILTGSSARNLRKKGVNLLAGRALTYNLYPLTAVELADQFDLSFSLKWGHLPALLQEEDPKKFLKSYIQTYLKEEVQQEALTRNLAQFSRFLEIASFSQGSAINVSEIARETGTNRVQIQTYFSILEDLLISSLLPIFTKRAKRRMANHPKFYFFDTGVFRTIRPLGPLDTQAEVDGPALETLCLQELRAINDYFELDYSLYYWRTQTGHEVDFILYGPHGLIAIEVKRKATLNKDDLSGLRLFKEDYPEALCLIFYGGTHKEYHGTITAIPMAEALKTLPSLLQPNQ